MLRKFALTTYEKIRKIGMKKGRKGCAVIMLLVTLFSLSLRVGAYSDGDMTSGADAVECGGTKVVSRFGELLFGNESKEPVKVIAGGGIFGARIKQSYVTVADPQGVKGLKIGDTLLSINGKEVKSINDVKEIMKLSHGEELTLVCKDGERKKTISLCPKSEGNEFKLGIALKDTTAGIGTVTYVMPNGEFGGLGHGICDLESGEPISISSGTVTGVILGGVQKGESGKPGELCGMLTDKMLGDVYKNTAAGVFGRLSTASSFTEADLIELGTKTDVKEGEATIRSTIKNGAPREYKIEIFEIDCNSESSKSFKIRVKDPALIALTGGIVRGMSGSPIIQNGKLVGAVTHVMVANPTEGYGIFIENMLNAAQSQVQPKAA